MILLDWSGCFFYPQTTSYWINFFEKNLAVTWPFQHQIASCHCWTQLWCVGGIIFCLQNDYNRECDWHWPKIKHHPYVFINLVVWAVSLLFVSYLLLQNPSSVDWLICSLISNALHSWCYTAISYCCYYTWHTVFPSWSVLPDNGQCSCFHSGITQRPRKDLYPLSLISDRLTHFTQFCTHQNPLLTKLFLAAQRDPIRLKS